ncbi:hypothetical protein GCM10025734_02370 [Kitasatospora paranensis]|uniref:glycosyl hydrolase-related protein n=1 Tax=Kitasatospora paranensis TaxID=258053 RepID=UPI00337BB10B
MPLCALQLRPGTDPAPTRHPGLRIRGARLTALKCAEDGNGLILRISNPTRHPATAHIDLPPHTRATPTRLDETPTDIPHAPGPLHLPMPPHALTTLRLTTP